MRNTIIATVLALGVAASASALELYRVTVTRIDSNVYKIEGGGGYIETRGCYEHAHRDDAVLRYERYGYNNKLIFSNGSACDVKGVR